MYIYKYIYIYKYVNVYIKIYIYYIYIYINLSRINRTTTNLLIKVSRFFHDLQVNVSLTKAFLDFLFQKALLIIYKHLGI